jgi:hypothetical protein
MNAIHRVIQRRGNNALNKEVDQNGTYMVLENTILPGRVILIITVIKIFGGTNTECQRIGGTGQK